MSGFRFQVSGWLVMAALASGCVARAGDMALIPAGSFQMGSTNLVDVQDDELPVHAVHVSTFRIDRHLVTNDKMVEVLNWAYGQGKLTVIGSEEVRNAEGDGHLLVDLDDSATRITWNGAEFGLVATKATNYPCINVSWYGAAAYCNYRTLMEGGGRTPCYDFSDWSCDWDATGYRLPTEAEWEKAARGGCERAALPVGGHDQPQQRQLSLPTRARVLLRHQRPRQPPDLHPDYAAGGSPYTSPVDAFAPNGYGLFDLAGNVLQWCGDWYTNSYYASSPGVDPRGPASGEERVLRGGSFFSQADVSRTSARLSDPPIKAYFNIGFRAVRANELLILALNHDGELIFDRTPAGGTHRVESAMAVTGPWDALTNAVTVDGTPTTLDAIPEGRGSVTCTVPVDANAAFYRIVAETNGSASILATDPAMDAMTTSVHEPVSDDTSQYTFRVSSDLATPHREVMTRPWDEVHALPQDITNRYVIWYCAEFIHEWGVDGLVETFRLIPRTNDFQVVTNSPAP